MTRYVIEVYVVVYWWPKRSQDIMTAVYIQNDKAQMEEFCSYLRDQGMVFDVQSKTVGL